MELDRRTADLLSAMLDLEQITLIGLKRLLRLAFGLVTDGRTKEQVTREMFSAVANLEPER